MMPERAQCYFYRLIVAFEMVYSTLLFQLRGKLFPQKKFLKGILTLIKPNSLLRILRLIQTCIICCVKCSKIESSLSGHVLRMH